MFEIMNDLTLNVSAHSKNIKLFQGLIVKLIELWIFIEIRIYLYCYFNFPNMK